MSAIKIITVFDNQIIRSGIKSILSDVNDVKIIQEMNNGQDIIEYLKINRPDIIITDIYLPEMSGIELTKTIKEKYPKIRIIILSSQTNRNMIYKAIKAGAKGFLSINSTRKEILEAVYTIRNGYEFYSRSISGIVLNNYLKEGKGDVFFEENEKNILSNREIEILRLFGNGYSNSQIADKLFISRRTVESHKNHIMQKLKLKSTVDLVKFGIRTDLIKI